MYSYVFPTEAASYMFAVLCIESFYSGVSSLSDSGSGVSASFIDAPCLLFYDIDGCMTKNFDHDDVISIFEYQAAFNNMIA